jgi:hypothetical protein
LLACKRGSTKQVSAQTDTVASMAVGEKAKVAHAMKAVGKHVKKKAPDELVRMKAHDLLTLATVSTVVFPSESHVVTLDSDDAAVGDGNPMSIATEIGEHLFRPAKRWFGVDDPFDAPSLPEMTAEQVGIIEMGEIVEEAKFAPSKGFGECCEEEPPKQP